MISLYIKLRLKTIMCLMLAFYSSCHVDPAFENSDCPERIPADLVEVKQVFFSPYKQMRYANSADSVSARDFRYNLEFRFSPRPSNSTEDEFFSQILESCHTKFLAQNISNIQIQTKKDFQNFIAGTDISYLFILPDDIQLSRFRDFANMETFLSLRMNIKIENPQRLESRIMVFLRNGEKLEIESISPLLFP